MEIPKVQKLFVYSEYFVGQGFDRNEYKVSFFFYIVSLSLTQAFEYQLQENFETRALYQV